MVVGRTAVGAVGAVSVVGRSPTPAIAFPAGFSIERTPASVRAGPRPNTLGRARRTSGVSARLATVVGSASAHSSDRWLLAWAMGYAAIGAASLLVPLYAIGLGAGPLVVGLLEATAGLAGVPGAVLWGRVADRTGNRRRFVLVTLGGTGVMLAAFPLVGTLPVALAANAVLWFLVAAASPVVTLFMIEDAAEADWEARIGLLNAYQRYGWVGGLVLGGLWLGAYPPGPDGLGALRTFFVVGSAAALASVPLAFYWLPPEATTPPGRLARSPRAVYRLVVGGGRYVKLVPFVPARAVVTLTTLRPAAALRRFPRPLRRYFLAVAVFSAAFSVFFGPVPAYLVGLELSASAVFAVFVVSSLASAVAFVPAGRLAARSDPARVQVRALGVRVALFPAIGLVGALAHPGLRGLGIVLGFALVGLTWAVIAVTAAGIVSRATPRAMRGEALGVYAALGGLGGGLGGVLGGVVASTAGYLAAFGLAGALVLVGAGLVVSSRPVTPAATACPDS